MKRRWKGITALGLSALIGCMAPVSTMMAAAEETETAGSAQEIEAVELMEEEPQETEAAEPMTEESQETEAVEHEAEESQETEAAEQEAEELQETEVIEPAAEEPQETEAAEQEAEESQETEVVEPADGDTQQSESVKATAKAAEVILQAVEGQEQAGKAAAPVIVIQFQGVNQARALSGKIGYNTYIGNRDQRLSVSASQDGNPVSFSYYLDTAAGDSDESKSEEQLSGLWQAAEQAAGQEISLAQDGAYVLYVKAEAADGQTVYARTDGIVIDATAPVITGIDNGGTYPEGTSFGVTDDNLESVLVNEQPARPSLTAGTYLVEAAEYSTSCVIRAKDKAGNETVYSITVEKKGTESDTDVIFISGDYPLKAGTAYRLGFGNWTLDGDSTVYRGGSTFYVGQDGTYCFTQHIL